MVLNEIWDEIGKEIVTRYIQRILPIMASFTRCKRKPKYVEDQEHDGKQYSCLKLLPNQSHVYMTDDNSGYRMYLLTDRSQSGDRG